METPNNDAPPVTEVPELLAETPPPVPGGDDFISSLDAAFKVQEEAEKGGTPPSTPENQPAKPEGEEEILSDNEVAQLAKKTREGFIKLKAKNKELLPFKTQAEELAKSLAEREAKIKELEAATAKLSRLEELEKVNKEYETKLAATRLEETPEFQEVIRKPAGVIREAATRLEAKYKLTEGKLIGILAEADPSKQNDQASEAVADMNDRDKIQFYQMLDDFAALMARRAQMQQNAKLGLDEIEARRQAAAEQQKQAAEAARKVAADKVWKALSQKVPFLAGAEAAISADIRSKADAANGEVPPEISAYRTYAGALLPHVVKSEAALKAEVASLKESLAKYAGASPGVSGGAGGGNSVDSKLSFLEAIEQQAR